MCKEIFFELFENVCINLKTLLGNLCAMFYLIFGTLYIFEHKFRTNTGFETVPEITVNEPVMQRF